MKNLIFLISLLLASPIYSQIGFDLNPALLGCIMSGGACFTNTGIPIVDSIFAGGTTTPHHTDESFCYAYLQNWCSGPAGYQSAYEQCRRAKKQFYKQAKQKMGEWPSFYDNQSSRESAYFNDLEKNKKVDFTCTPKQQEIWLKNRCSHTQQYQHRKNRARIKTERCDG